MSTQTINPPPPTPDSYVPSPTPALHVCSAEAEQRSSASPRHAIMTATSPHRSVLPQSGAHAEHAPAHEAPAAADACAFRTAASSDALEGGRRVYSGALRDDLEPGAPYVHDPFHADEAPTSAQCSQRLSSRGSSRRLRSFEVGATPGSSSSRSATPRRVRTHDDAAMSPAHHHQAVSAALQSILLHDSDADVRRSTALPQNADSGSSAASEHMPPVAAEVPPADTQPDSGLQTVLDAAEAACRAAPARALNPPSNRSSLGDIDSLLAPLRQLPVPRRSSGDGASSPLAHPRLPVAVDTNSQADLERRRTQCRSPPRQMQPPQA